MYVHKHIVSCILCSYKSYLIENDVLMHKIFEFICKVLINVIVWWKKCLNTAEIQNTYFLAQ